MSHIFFALTNNTEPEHVEGIPSSHLKDALLSHSFGAPSEQAIDSFRKNRNFFQETGTRSFFIDCCHHRPCCGASGFAGLH